MQSIEHQRAAGAIEALETATDSLQKLNTLFRALGELARIDSPQPPELRRDFLASLADVGHYCASDWAGIAERDWERLQRDPPRVAVVAEPAGSV